MQQDPKKVAVVVISKVFNICIVENRGLTVFGQGFAMQVYAFFCFIVTLLFFYQFYDLLDRRSSVNAAKPSKIRNLKRGLVYIRGTIKDSDDTILAPYSGRECVYYHYVVEKYGKERNSGSGPRGSAWRVIHEEKDYAKILLEDNSGVAQLRLANCQFDIPARTERLNRGQIDGHGALTEVANMLLPSQKYRHTETIIAPGEFLYVIGSAKTQKNQIPKVHYGREKRLFVSTKPKRSQSFELLAKALGCFALSLVSAVSGALLLTMK